MGTPLPPIIVEPGNLCALAWGPGKPFEPPTPTVITMQLHDNIEGDSWNPAWESELLSPVVLTQNIVNPCAFWVNTLNFTWGWRWDAGSTFGEVFHRFSPWLQAFLGGPLILGLKKIDNIVPDDPAAVLHGGYAEITFGGE